MELQNCICFSYKALQIFCNVSDSNFPYSIAYSRSDNRAVFQSSKSYLVCRGTNLDAQAELQSGKTQVYQ